MFRNRYALVALLMLLLSSAAQDASAKPIVIGSKPFTESRLLAEIMAQMLEAKTDLEVERRFGLAGTKIVFAALQTGEVDIYPEYTGTGWTVMLKRTTNIRSSLRAFLEVQREFEERYQLKWLAPFGFSNSYALAMSKKKAKELGITRISDLVPHQANLSAGVSHEFLKREDGFPGLKATYGLELGDVKGMEHGLAYKAIRTGKIDIIDAYTTDGKLLIYDVEVLEDDRHAFPPYDAAPLMRSDTLERHPEIGKVLAVLAFRLDAERMRKLNHDAEERGGAFAEVAAEFLVAEKLLEKQADATITPTQAKQSFLGYMWGNRGNITNRILEHLLLTALAVLLAIFLGVPLGVALTRRTTAAPAVLGAAGVIQTIPGLAMLAFMIPIPGLGLGMRSAVVALFLYALLPIVRNAFTGIQEVDQDLVEAARAMGLTNGQVLMRVELPLALRTVMAGIRTSTVITVGVATLAAFIGAGGLGDPIVTGLQLDDIYLILSGAVPAALLAVIVDGALGLLEKRLVPAGMRAAA
jgi:osmoprotectant transport system permease protein